MAEIHDVQGGCKSIFLSFCSILIRYIFLIGYILEV